MFVFSGLVETVSAQTAGYGSEKGCPCSWEKTNALPVVGSEDNPCADAPDVFGYLGCSFVPETDIFKRSCVGLIALVA